MHNFKKIVAWQKARILVKEIYFLTKKLQKEEKYGLISQINRSAISIPSNIAEGSAKSSNKDFARFLEIALGSSFELETQIFLCFDLKLISEKECGEFCDKINETQRLIYSFKKSLLKKEN